ncbi:MAG: S41 family peptidase [Dysgonamonadaceae bacterium]|nr:S41 family peptidase [Dysgonamonadaceae bacterium]
MKQLIFSCMLILTMLACSYGQNTITFGHTTSSAAAQKIGMAINAVENLYVDELNSNKLAEDAIISMLEKLDPHSNYMTPEEVKEMNEPLQGNFDGIGIQFNMLTDTLYVVHVIPCGPSEKVGLLVGDRILQVDDTLIAGVKMKNTDVMSHIRGPKGTTVNLKVLRNGEPKLLNFKIVRDKIPIYSLGAFYMIDETTGYIKLNRFAATTYNEFKTALDTLVRQGMVNLILDLQDNGGGYLGTAIEIANEFLQQGSLIVYTEGVHQKREDARATNKGAMQNGRLVVIVNEASASASEIVTGAIQDWDRGVIVGRRTFGKGLVQRPVPLLDGSMIRLTTARYYTPTGRSIQKPYENGNQESYAKDLIDRGNRGEMISADSIHFSDSLKFSTLVNKRTVYGGGGIMPDYFVPLDTTFRSTLLGELNSNQITYKYTTRLIDSKRSAYKTQYPDFKTYNKDFAVTDQMLNELIESYRKDTTINKEDSLSEERIAKDLVKSASLLKAQIKALIARDIFGENEYYQVINKIIVPYNQAIEIISDDKVYNKLLSLPAK